MSAISEKYASLGGSDGFLGYPTTDEIGSPDGRGSLSHYQHGSIYWHPDTEAHEVHGAIRGRWAELGWEMSLLGYPTTDEIGSPDGRGSLSHFQHGSIYWHPDTGAHEVHGAIRERWSSHRWEMGFLGYPTSDELPYLFGRLSRFQKGVIYWSPRVGAQAVRLPMIDKWNAKKTVWLVMISIMILIVGNVAALVLLLLNYVFNKLLDGFFDTSRR